MSTITLELTSTSTVRVPEIQYSSTASTSTEYENPSPDHEAGDLRRYRTHYDVNIMDFGVDDIIQNSCEFSWHLVFKVLHIFYQYEYIIQLWKHFWKKNSL